MNAALISLGSISSQWTIREMKRYFDAVDDVSLREIEVNLGTKGIEVLYKGRQLQHYDCIYAKGSFRYADVLRTVTESRYGESYMPLEPMSFTIGHDKLLTHIALNHAKVPMPDTYIASSLESAKHILNRIPYPIVMKFPQGTQGRGVMFADSFASASSILDALSALKQPFLIQQFIDTDGTDIRAIVIGDKVASAMRRIGAPQESRANIHAGGKGEPCALDYKTAKIAVDTAKAVGAEICAVDILESPKGPLVIEANLSPGLQGITRVTADNVAGRLAGFLAEKTKKLIEAKTEKNASRIFDEANLRKDLSEQQIITNIDFRGSRMLLPKVITDMSEFAESDEFVIHVSRGKITVEKYG